ncbi:glycosyltransferase family 4 protein [Acidisphaera rubrifaciens]|uniref:Undecaprenyl-phosphate alpha-N-acetylglucosaminephosphotransferase n=1 Tax=Acidisphaera rubrifaciens HS-AP3 TaxID=1231350 RepID=A0A0D6P607_9PROT|nr:MraY family glycosyltransferase [Acidisphaera rubrifaciens]GAN76319.1 undecaprenyl-phosphate alpha-N-acetylglucosaminephosphotransferase [Acidisphaera rubrifaciens HS-AP3]
MQAQALARHLLFAAALAVFSAVIVRAMIAVRVMDMPDTGPGARKAHARPTPKGGGVGIVAAFLTGVLGLYQYAEFARLADPYFRGVIVAAAAIALVAFLDDLRDWPFTVKLAAQVLAALAAVASGLLVRLFTVPGLGAIDVGPVAGAALTLGWILFATNAMNFIDGLNGLAAGVALVAGCFLAGIAADAGGWFVYFASLLLIAGLAGFLPFNFPRARIFMGDVGSQFCGFVLAVLGVAAARFDGMALSFLIVPLLLHAVLFDVAFTLLRRARAGARLTAPHRGHLYQLAQRSGMPAPAIAVLHWGFAAYGGMLCLALLGAPASLRGIVPLACVPPQAIWAVYVLRRAGRAGVRDPG